MEVVVAWRVDLPHAAADGAVVPGQTVWFDVRLPLWRWGLSNASVKVSLPDAALMSMG